MGFVKRNSILLLLLVSITGCYQFEFSGFVSTDTAVDERFEQSLAWNAEQDTLHLALGDDNYTLFAMGDSHVGNTKNIDRFFEAAIEQGVLATLLVGDITTGHQEDYDTLIQHLPNSDALNIFPMVGNHDLYFDGWKDYYALWGSSSYFFNVTTPKAKDLFICLDTGSGTLGQKQMAWLENVLTTQRETCRHCIIFTHNNIFRLRPTFSTNPMVEEVQRLTDLCLRYEVNMLVTGHDHQRNTDILGHTTHIIMDAMLDSNEDASYLKIDLNASIHYSFIDL